MIALDLQQIISQTIAFLILVWIMNRFAWKPLLAVLDQRKSQIAGDLERAAKSRDEMQRLQEDYTKRIAHIEEEARAKIQEAVNEGKQVSVEIQEQARAQARSVLDKAKESVDLEVAKARVTLRNEISSMTVKAVEQILRRKLDEKTDEQLVESVVSELEQKGAPQ